MKVDKKKFESTSKIPKPKTIKDIFSFLGEQASIEGLLKI